MPVDLQVAIVEVAPQPGADADAMDHQAQLGGHLGRIAGGVVDAVGEQDHGRDFGRGQVVSRPFPAPRQSEVAWPLGIRVASCSRSSSGMRPIGEGERQQRGNRLSTVAPLFQLAAGPVEPRKARIVVGNAHRGRGVQAENQGRLLDRAPSDSSAPAGTAESRPAEWPPPGADTMSATAGTRARGTTGGRTAPPTGAPRRRPPTSSSGRILGQDSVARENNRRVQTGENVFVGCVKRTITGSRRKTGEGTGDSERYIIPRRPLLRR